MRQNNKRIALLLALCMLLVFGAGSTVYAAEEAPILEETTVAEDAAVAEDIVIDEVAAEEAPAEEAEAPLAEAQLNGMPYVPGQIVVVFDQGGEAAAQACAEEEAAQVQAINHIDGVGDAVLIKIAEGQSMERAVAAYSAKSGVKYAHPNYVFKTQANVSQLQQAPQGSESVAQSTPNDPLFENEWYYKKVDAGSAADMIAALPQREKVRVAVVDTIVDMKHEDLANIVNRDISRDFTNGVMETYPDITENSQTHGSHVSGIIAAEANNGKGIAGVASGTRNQVVELMSCRVLDDGGIGTSYNIAMGVAWANECNANVINMSLGGLPSYPEGSAGKLVEDAIDKAVENGAVVVVAAGNENTDAYSTPSDYDSVISVIATTDYKDPNVRCKTNFSNFGTAKDVSAPGERILSTVPGGKYEYMDGTSMASPVVAGVVALMRYANPNLTPALIKKGLESTAEDLYFTGFDTTTAWGNVNAKAAVEYALKDTPPDPPAPKPVPYSPKDTKAVNEFGGNIKLEWTSLEDSDGYFILRSEAKYKSDMKQYKRIDKVEQSGLDKYSYTDTSVQIGKRYCYTVLGYKLDEQGNPKTGYFGNTLYATARCAAPENFKAAGQSKSSIKAEWSKTDGADGYYLYRSSKASGGFKLVSKIAGAEKTGYTDSGLKPATKYYYKLIAYTNSDRGALKGATAGAVAAQTKSK